MAPLAWREGLGDWPEVTEALVAVMQDMGEWNGDLGFTLLRCTGAEGRPPYEYCGSVRRSLKEPAEGIWPGLVRRFAPSLVAAPTLVCCCRWRRVLAACRSGCAAAGRMSAGAYL